MHSLNPLRRQPPESSHSLGRFAGRYALLRKLGAGGMATVYLAEEEVTRRTVALKQLHSPRAGDDKRMLEALFEREYHTLVRLKHPRIIEVYDYGLTREGPYYTMELLEGTDLQKLAPLAYRQVCMVLRDVASSLALLHAQRLVHRDVTPRNVRFTQDGRAKLIDFGAVTTFGVATEIVGTPAFMAPEVAGRMPLDQRADLFSLGALGYWALSGRPPFPARNLRDLFTAWQAPPASLSQTIPDLPAQLDNLILALVSIDPLARPLTAADVIDQLTVIAGLEPEEHEQASQSYLLSGAMVHRETERAWFGRRLQRALDGQGAEIVIEGGPGDGKTRLLHELSLEAQLRGVVTLKADAQTRPDAYGVTATLALQLVRVCPELARNCAASQARVLGHLSSELRTALEVRDLLPLSEDANERRARLQTALHDWFMQIAKQQRLLLAIDNVQAADERSAAFLAGLGHEARSCGMLLLVTQRTGDAVVAEVPLSAIRKHAGRLKLAGLPAAGCEDLVRSLFGEVAYAGRLARLLHEQAGGNPQRCMDLTQFLARKGVIRYIAGSWVLPLEIGAHELPDRMDEILAARIDDLSAPARALADMLSIHGKPVSIEHCLAHAEGITDADTHAALDELVAREIIVAQRPREIRTLKLHGPSLSTRAGRPRVGPGRRRRHDAG